MRVNTPLFLFDGTFLITVLISVLGMGILRLSISSWFSFGRLCFSNNLFISSKLSFFFFFNFIVFNLILYWSCHISKWICHRYACVPHPEPCSLLAPHTIPLGCPSAPGPSIQYHAWNLDWRLVSYMIFYIFQCHSPKSSHPIPSHRVPKTVLYIRVSFAVSYTGLLLPSF